MSRGSAATEGVQPKGTSGARPAVMRAKASDGAEWSAITVVRVILITILAFVVVGSFTFWQSGRVCERYDYAAGAIAVYYCYDGVW